MLNPLASFARRVAFLYPLLAPSSSALLRRQTLAFLPPPAATNPTSISTVPRRPYTILPPAAMPRGVKKENLPSKVCVVCDRPFTWRKKWERCWDEVTTCSKSCNRKRRASNRGGGDRSMSTEVGATEAGTDDEVVEEVFFRTYPPSSGSADAEDGIRSKSANEADGNAKDGLSSDVSDGAVLSGLDESLAFLELHEAADAGLSNLEDAAPEDAFDFDIETADSAAAERFRRKAAKKAQKAARRAQREGRGDPDAGRKPCDMCGTRVDLLVRCTYDASEEWRMVCGKCWKVASGGVVDGDASHPHYRYGGLWKNRRKRA